MTCSVSRVLDGGSIQLRSRRLVCAAKSAKQVLQPQKRLDAGAESYQFPHEEGKWRKNIHVVSWIRGRRETNTQPVSTVKTDMKGRTNRRDHATVKQLRCVWHFKCRPPFITERLDYKVLRSGGNNNYLSKSVWKGDNIHLTGFKEYKSEAIHTLAGHNTFMKSHACRTSNCTGHFNQR